MKKIVFESLKTYLGQTEISKKELTTLGKIKSKTIDGDEYLSSDDLLTFLYRYQSEKGVSRLINFIEQLRYAELGHS